MTGRRVLVEHRCLADQSETAVGHLAALWGPIDEAQLFLCVPPQRQLCG